jgi:hypothetical protein
MASSHPIEHKSGYPIAESWNWLSREIARSCGIDPLSIFGKDHQTQDEGLPTTVESPQPL